MYFTSNIGTKMPSNRRARKKPHNPFVEEQPCPISCASTAVCWWQSSLTQKIGATFILGFLLIFILEKSLLSSSSRLEVEAGFPGTKIHHSSVDDRYNSEKKKRESNRRRKQIQDHKIAEGQEKQAWKDIHDFEFYDQQQQDLWRMREEQFPHHLPAEGRGQAYNRKRDKPVFQTGGGDSYSNRYSQQQPKEQGRAWKGNEMGWKQHSQPDIPTDRRARSKNIKVATNGINNDDPASYNGLRDPLPAFLPEGDWGHGYPAMAPDDWYYPPPFENELGPEAVRDNQQQRPFRADQQQLHEGWHPYTSLRHGDDFSQLKNFEVDRHHLFEEGWLSHEHPRTGIPRHQVREPGFGNQGRTEGGARSYNGGAQSFGAQKGATRLAREAAARKAGAGSLPSPQAPRAAAGEAAAAAHRWHAAERAPAAWPLGHPWEEGGGVHHWSPGAGGGAPAAANFPRAHHRDHHGFPEQRRPGRMDTFPRSQQPQQAPPSTKTARQAKEQGVVAGQASSGLAEEASLFGGKRANLEHQGKGKGAKGKSREQFRQEDGTAFILEAEQAAGHKHLSGALTSIKPGSIDEKVSKKDAEKLTQAHRMLEANSKNRGSSRQEKNIDDEASLSEEILSRAGAYEKKNPVEIDGGGSTNEHKRMQLPKSYPELNDGPHETFGTHDDPLDDFMIETMVGDSASNDTYSSDEVYDNLFRDELLGREDQFSAQKPHHARDHDDPIFNRDTKNWPPPVEEDNQRNQHWVAPKNDDILRKQKKSTPVREDPACLPPWFAAPAAAARLEEGWAMGCAELAAALAHPAARPIARGYWRTAVLTEWRGRPIVVKELRENHKENQRNLDRHIREAVTHSLLKDHENVVRFLGRCGTTTAAEYVPVTLQELLLEWDVDLPYPKALHLALGAARGLAALHAGTPGGPVAHADVADKQFLVTYDGTVKINDFNRCRFVHRDPASGKTCPFYIYSNGGFWRSPEEYLLDADHEHGPGLTEKIDIYSLGLLLWELLARRPPFHWAADEAEARRLVVAGARPPLGEGWPAPYVQLIKSCWAQSPDQRPDAETVVLVLERLLKIQNNGERKRSADMPKVSTF